MRAPRDQQERAQGSEQDSESENPEEMVADDDSIPELEPVPPELPRELSIEEIRMAWELTQQEQQEWMAIRRMLLLAQIRQHGRMREAWGQAIRIEQTDHRRMIFFFQSEPRAQGIQQGDRRGPATLHWGSFRPEEPDEPNNNTPTNDANENDEAGAHKAGSKPS